MKMGHAMVLSLLMNGTSLAIGLLLVNSPML
jgi:hypothetical protein